MIDDTIKGLHKRQTNNIKKIEPSEGQRGLLCNTKELNRCPSLCLEEEDKRIEEMKPILKNLISHIIREELRKHLENQNDNT